MYQMLIQTFYSALSQRHKLASQAFAMPQEEPLILHFQPATTPCSQFRRSEALCWESETPACTSDIMGFDNRFHASFAVKAIRF